MGEERMYGLGGGVRMGDGGGADVRIRERGGDGGRVTNNTCDSCGSQQSFPTVRQFDREQIEYP